MGTKFAHLRGQPKYWLNTGCHWRPTYDKHPSPDLPYGNEQRLMADRRMPARKVLMIASNPGARDSHQPAPWQDPMQAQEPRSGRHTSLPWSNYCGVCGAIVAAGNKSTRISRPGGWPTRTKAAVIWLGQAPCRQDQQGEGRLPR